MPPEGYNTVTLPYDLIETLDGLTDMSRAATIRMLVAEYRTDTDDGDGPVTLEAGEYAKIADEVEGRMR